MFVQKSFQIKELVCPEVYKIRGDASIQLIDIRIVNVAQWIHDHLGPVTINNWEAGGPYHDSGLRSFLCTTGALFSQHKCGRALDLKVKGKTPEEVRTLIRDNWEELKALGLTTIEKDTPGWVHIDCRFTGLDHLLEVAYVA